MAFPLRLLQVRGDRHAVAARWLNSGQQPTRRPQARRQARRMTCTNGLFTNGSRPSGRTDRLEQRRLLQAGNASDRIRDAGKQQIDTKLRLGGDGITADEQRKGNAHRAEHSRSAVTDQTTKMDWIYGVLPGGQGALVADLVQDIVDIAVAVATFDRKGLQREYAGLMRFRYKLNRAIWTDLTGQYYLLIFAVLTLAVVGGTLYAAVTGEEFGEALWHAETLVLDSGNVADEVPTFAARSVGLFLTLVGLFLVSVLVGVVTEAIALQVDSVTSNPTATLETGHIVVLNWSACAPRLVRELGLGSRDTGSYKTNNTIVVLADMDQKTMLSMLRVYESSASPAEVLCVQGSPQLLGNLENVAVCNARGIVILSDSNAAQSHDESDANAICTMLALTKAARKAGVPLPPVGMEVHSPETVALVRRTFGDSVFPILVGAFAAKMTVQSILMPGIANVFTSILSFDGSEFYVEPIPKYMVGATYGKLCELVRGAIPVGLQKHDKLELLPAESQIIKPGHQVVLLQTSNRAADLSQTRLDRNADGWFPATEQDAWGDIQSWDEEDDEAQVMVKRGNQQTDMEMEKARQRKLLDLLFDSLDDARLSRSRPSSLGKGVQGPVLICGWRPGAGILVQTLDKIMKFGSEVHILADIPLIDRESLLMRDGINLDLFENIKMCHFQGQPGSMRDLQQLPMATSGRYTAAVLLANSESYGETDDSLAADAVRIKSALMLRDFLTHGSTGCDLDFDDCQTYLVTEVSGASSDACLPFSEFVRVGVLDVMAMSQVIFQPALYNLQMQLVEAGEGAGLTLEPVGIVAEPDEKLTFKALSARVKKESAGNSLLIGYRHGEHIELNPGNPSVVCSADIKLIILNRTHRRKIDTYKPSTVQEPGATARDYQFRI